MKTRQGSCFVMWSAEWYRVLWNEEETPIEVRVEKDIESLLPDHSGKIYKYARLWVDHDAYGQLTLAQFIKKTTDDWK